MGIGKTSLAAKFEKSLILAFEMGTNALSDVYVQPIKTWKDFKDVMKQLTKTNYEELSERFYNIAIDTIDEAYKLCEKYVCNKYGVETVKEIAAFGAGYKILDDEFMTPFREITYAGYGIVFISHDAEKTDTNEKGEEISRIIPALPKRPLSLINKMVDVIGYIREIKDEAGNSERNIFFRAGEKALTKSRFRFITPKIPLDYNAYLNAIYDAIDKEVAATNSEATNESNPYATRTFEEAMEEARTMWTKIVNNELTDQASKILEEEFGKPTKFSEILPEQMEKLNNVLIELQALV